MKLDLLVDHQGAHVDLLTLDLALLDELILLVEERHEAWTVMSTVALGREMNLIHVIKRIIKKEWHSHSRCWNFENSPLSKRIWNAVQIKGAPACVLFTVSLPNENPVPIG